MTASNFWALGKKVRGKPQLRHFLKATEYLRDIEDGELLLEAEYLTIDCYIKEAVMSRMVPGTPFPCTQLARVVKSRHEDYTEGDFVVGYFGWRDVTIVSPNLLPTSVMGISKMPVLLRNQPNSFAASYLGVSGLIAYYGVIEGCLPVGGDTCVVTGACGGVGIIASQIARIKGCKVIAFVGSDNKLQWMKKHLAFPQMFNYRQIDNIYSLLKKICPEGVDCFFDTMGGEFAYEIMKHMNDFGRVAQVGNMEKLFKRYDDPEYPQEPLDYYNLRHKQLRVQGIAPPIFYGKEEQAIDDIRKWIKKKKIIVEETIVEGLDNMPQAFIDMMDGKNIGKQLVKHDRELW